MTSAAQKQRRPALRLVSNADCPTVFDTFTEAERWEIYEAHKRKLQAMCIDPSEYEQRLTKMAEELGL